MRIASVDSRVVKGSVGVQYMVTLGNFQKWLVYCSEPVVLIWKDNQLSASTPLRGYIRVAILPNRNAEDAFFTLLNYVQKYPTGGAVSFTYPTGSTAEVSIDFTTVGTGPLAMLALPHHVQVLKPIILNSEESKKLQASYSPIYCIKGKMKAIVGDGWKLSYNLVQVGWNFVVGDKLSTSQLDLIARHLMIDVKLIPPSAIDPYSFGKELARMARLVLIADTFGIADVRAQALTTLKSSFLPWLQGTNSNPLLYDKTWGGLVTTTSLSDPNADFGSGWYSDHHFHYGYFIYAAAVLARHDGTFFEANRGALEAFVRDVCNPDSTDPDFPFARHKDLYDGHSWASGLFPQANGKGQESSSEVSKIFYRCNGDVCCARDYFLQSNNSFLITYLHLCPRGDLLGGECLLQRIFVRSGHCQP
jgi:endo-1,3(4)-beta-glucanase